MKSTEYILCQYSATGAFFYSVYEGETEIARVVSVMRPKISEIGICSKLGNYISYHDMEVTIFRGLKRIILNESAESAAELVWKNFDNFEMRYKNEKIDILQGESGFEGNIDGKRVVTAEILKRDLCINSKYEKQGYDLTRMYKVTFENEISEQMRIWISAYPMLKFV